MEEDDECIGLDEDNVRDVHSRIKREMEKVWNK
jgi:hypothetical protein